MDGPNLRLQAESLRRQGKSLNFIAQRLSIAKSTTSIWCRDVYLTKAQKLYLKQNQIKSGAKGRALGTFLNKQKKVKQIQEGEVLGLKMINKLSNRDLLVAGTALYWAEGTKSIKWRMAFTNSDPLAIRFALVWFRAVFKVPKKDFMPRIYINDSHRDRSLKIIHYWSRVLSLPISQFGSPVFLKMKHKRVYENRETYYGVIALGVRNSNQIKYKVLGLINALQKAGVAQW